MKRFLIIFLILFSIFLGAVWGKLRFSSTEQLVESVLVKSNFLWSEISYHYLSLLSIEEVKMRLEEGNSLMIVILGSLPHSKEKTDRSRAVDLMRVFLNKGYKFPELLDNQCNELSFVIMAREMTLVRFIEKENLLKSYTGNQCRDNLLKAIEFANVSSDEKEYLYKVFFDK